MNIWYKNAIHYILKLHAYLFHYVLIAFYSRDFENTFYALYYI